MAITPPPLRTTIWVGVLALVAYALGVVSTYVTIGTQPIGLGGMAVALAAVGGISFLGFYSRDGEVRGALAASMTIFYFTLFSASLNEQVRTALNNELGKQMISNLTALLTAVAAFYLGGKAVEAVTRIREEGMTARLSLQPKMPPTP